MIDSNGTAALGVPALDLAVLSALYDAELTPAHNHRKSADVLLEIAGAGLCGIEDGYRVLQRLSASWLMPLPLVDPHGNLGSMYDSQAPPTFTEVRLTAAGAMVVEAHRGDLPLLPVGLINGTLPLVLGLDFGLWPFDDERPRSGKPQLRVRPGFEPAALVAALAEVADHRRTTNTALATIIGSPWLGPFEPVDSEWSQLYESGEQSVQLTPVPSHLDGWAHPPAEILLDLGAPSSNFCGSGSRAPVTEHQHRRSSINSSTLRAPHSALGLRGSTQQLS